MTLLTIDQLEVRLPVDRAARPILSGVSLHVDQGETVGLVGESGSGKSVTCRTVLGQLPRGATATGRVLVKGDDVLAMDSRALRRLRSSEVAMVFQDPRAAVDPLRRVGDFVTEVLRTNLGYDRRRAEARACELLEEVGIRDARRALRQWPHEFSGGMLQRVVIAAALAARPGLLLADEATTALDVTTQAEVVSILKRLAAENDTGVLLVTHDLELAAAVCDRIYVMYAGQVIEAQPVADLFATPRHPYTAALLAATPRLDGEATVPAAIPGRPPGLGEPLRGCPFAPRCSFAEHRCETEYAGSLPAGQNVVSACVRSAEILTQLSRPDDLLSAADGAGS
ncbi:ABC transporter ATP-binding protein [Nocardioides sp. LHG3406-4]|uniref:ABC transporter ATP-binding protein n=1 Tax=Nocardioides sp. LHG3406-4 TaxID=2804575 RepID=UPI003CEFCD50